MAQHGDHCDPETAVASPVLSVGDFDGNGTVSIRDLILVIRQRARRSYVAFYDRNADYRLNGWDIWATVFELGDSSSALDQELASVYWATNAFRDQDTAIAAGYSPFTPAFAGHGEHYAQHPAGGAIDYNFEATNPEGLNYDDDGKLWAVFYSYGPDPTQGFEGFNPFATAPAGFSGHHDKWHHHAGACILGLDFEDMTMDAEELDFLQCIGPGMCGLTAAIGGHEAFQWSPKFHMLHLWIYSLNPCGTFAGTNPNLMPDARDPEAEDPGPCDITDVVDADDNGADDDYPFSPVPQLCRWAAEIGVSIPPLGCS